MTKASTALHHILTTYPITPTQLTTALEISTATFTAWLQGHLAPPSDRLAALISTLHQLNPQAAEDVIQRYLEDSPSSPHTPTPQPSPQHPRPGPVIQRHHQRLQIPLLPLPTRYSPSSPLPAHQPDRLF